MKTLEKSVATLLVFLFIALPVNADKQENTYKIPDVRDAFCGPEIAPRFCKCAFHNQCGKEMDSDASYNYVLSEFHAWNRQKIQSMGEACLRADGHWNRSTWTCVRCTEGDERVGTRCVEPEKVDPEVAECKQAEKDFNRDWKKFSDFDERIPISEASNEVQQYDRVLDEIGGLIAEVYELETQMQLQAEYRKELRVYKDALVQNIKTNLLKAFWRLSYVTYTTTKGAMGQEGSIRKVLDPASQIEVLGAGMKLVQANTPGHVKELQVSDGTIKGKLKSIRFNASLEIIESAGDPSAVVQQVMKDVKGAVVPSADISPEEIAILRTQHLDNNAVDAALAESYAESTAMRGQIFTLEAKIANKYNELQEWKAKEYQRVQLGLLEQCKNKLD